MSWYKIRQLTPWHSLCAENHRPDTLFEFEEELAGWYHLNLVNSKWEEFLLPRKLSVTGSYLPYLFMIPDAKLPLQTSHTEVEIEYFGCAGALSVQTVGGISRTRRSPGECWRCWVWAECVTLLPGPSTTLTQSHTWLALSQTYFENPLSLSPSSGSFFQGELPLFPCRQLFHIGVFVCSAQLYVFEYAARHSHSNEIIGLLFGGLKFHPLHNLFYSLQSQSITYPLECVASCHSTLILLGWETSKSGKLSQ